MSPTIYGRWSRDGRFVVKRRTEGRRVMGAVASRVARMVKPRATMMFTGMRTSSAASAGRLRR